jgi:hypothetical protein
METVSQVLSAQIFIDGCYKAIADRSESDWIDICDKAIAESNFPRVIGFLNSLLKNDVQSFRWAMYQISIRRGYEELIANFFIGTYQIEHGKTH